MTMAETVLEKAVCEKCGVDVRDESSFCYNCGGPVSESPTEIPKDVAEETALEPRERPPLTSAASLRKHRRAANRQRLEVTWEPPEDGTPKAFVISTIVLTVGAIVLLLLASYLR
jgi:hypothetical protein